MELGAKHSPSMTMQQKIEIEHVAHQNARQQSATTSVVRNGFSIMKGGIDEHSNENDVGIVSTKKKQNVVVVRYYLDRPGYGLHNSAARIWFNAPAKCYPDDIRTFLTQQNIALQDLVIEIFMDRFGSYMLLDACDDAEIEWDFSLSYNESPGFLIIRFTDTSAISDDGTYVMGSPNEHGSVSSSSHVAASREFANATPIGVFAFSMVIGLDNAMLLTKLTTQATAESFMLTFGPYGFFIGGLLQLLAGIFEVVRNNLYGGVAFSVFGGFWLANGTKFILQTHFSGENSGPAYEYGEISDKWGKLILDSYVLAFVLVLLKQTLVMNKLSTAVIAALALYIGSMLFTSWFKSMIYVQLVLGFMVSLLGFYLFTAEFTNQVYHRDVFDIFPWSKEHSPEEIFGAPGTSRTLLSKAARLRQASYGVSSLSKRRIHQTAPHLKDEKLS